MPPARVFASENIRCCTLIGHVDHGKSSYADSLLAANGIISSRSAGKVRYLDSREDEQERGITMESSAVSLNFKLRRFQEDGQVAGIADYMLNLIDTPGHVDFSSEVSTASRLCDSALVIVDVVEGVCSQTVAVLRQAWLDGLRTILVINKVDRLITELQLTPNEAYHRLVQLVEQANAVIGGFYAAERMELDQRLHEEAEAHPDAGPAGDDATGAPAESAPQDGTADAAPEIEEHDEEGIYFDPARGNVIFASAVDQWAFRLERFSMLYSKKLGIKEQNIRRFLWGNYYLDPKTKRVLTQKQRDKEKRNMKPMFVQFVLDNIWSVYENTVVNRNMEMVDRVISALELKVHPRDLRTKDDAMLLTAIMSQWLPLPACTFSAMVNHLPAPAEAQRTRVPRMLRPELGYFASEQELAWHTPLERDLFESRAGDDAAAVAYISKMFAVPTEELPEHKRVQLSADEMRQRGREIRERTAEVHAALSATGATLDSTAHPESAGEQSNGGDAGGKPDVTEEKPSGETVLGFARLYSGNLSVGDTVWAVLPKYDASQPADAPANAPHLQRAQIEALYMIMGRDLISVRTVPAGNVFGVRGLNGIVLRNGTLCKAPRTDAASAGADAAPPAELVNLVGVRRTATPIVRVALEPRNPADMPKLAEGLRLLNQADPCVEVLVQDTGEHVILTAGELHLERCLRDLRERFARCKIQQSPPLVPFRETAVRGSDMAPPKTEGAPRGTMRGTAMNGLVSYTVRALPLPQRVRDFLVVNAGTIRRVMRRGRARAQQDEAGEQEEDEAPSSARAPTEDAGADADQPRRVPVRAFWDELAQELRQAGGEWASLAERICAFGPRGVGANLLLDTSGTLRSVQQRQASARRDTELAGRLQGLELSADESRVPRELVDAVETGFQMATGSGPLCAEPMQGMAFVVQELALQEEAAQDTGRARLSQLTSSLISGVREACRNGLLDWSPRLMLAMYSCEIQAAPEVQGKVHAVLSRRRGRVVSEEMKEGTLFFTIGALLPVVESFGFADEVRKRTSGAASPQLLFAGFYLYDQDPFWVPRTEEELEDLGEKGDRENVAKRYMDLVRKRKVRTAARARGRGARPAQRTAHAHLAGTAHQPAHRRVRREAAHAQVQLGSAAPRRPLNSTASWARRVCCSLMQARVASHTGDQSSRVLHVAAAGGQEKDWHVPPAGAKGVAKRGRAESCSAICGRASLFDS